jgi:DNA-binding MarR family transcriptional regulator
MKQFNLDRWLVYRLWRISQEAGFELEAWYRKKFGLSAAEWHSVAVLANHAPLSAKDLAKILDISQVQMTRTLSRLLAANLVYRRTDRTDRRKILLGLSSKGGDLYQQIAPKAAAVEEKMLVGLSAQERGQLDALITRLERSFRP